MAQKLRGTQPWRSNRAGTLRANQTSAETRLWSYLRNRQLGGFKFVRQAPVGPYFADFLCREERLIVEVDGATHGEADEIDSDARRTVDLERLGFRLFRVTNVDVRSNLEGVLEELLVVLRRSDRE